jgi:glycosyltransferase involved in cell wall biosynthesis
VKPTARLLQIGCREAETPFTEHGIVDGVVYTGYAEPDTVSRLLSSGDLFLAPYIDGISARRGSAIAALAHGLPTLSTDGELTDLSTFESSPVVMTHVGDEAAYIAAAERLAVDEQTRTALRTPLLDFHQRHFSWTSIADSLVARAMP